MKSKEAYYEFHVLLNKNASLRNVNISKANYVLLFNREGSLALDNMYKRDSTINVQDWESLLIYNKKLIVSEVSDTYSKYLLPENFQKFVDSYSVTEKDGCVSKTINLPVKPKDEKIEIQDGSYVNFDFEESICNIAENFLIVQKNNYKIKDTYLSYYKKFPKIDIEGYTIDDIPSQDIDPQISDLLVHKINNLVVLEVQRQFENGNGFKLSQDRVINNN